MAEKRATNVLSGRTLAFIGGGAMAGAMIGGLLNSHAVDPTGMTASDPHAERTKDLETRFNVATTTDNLEAARDATSSFCRSSRRCCGLSFAICAASCARMRWCCRSSPARRVESMTQG